MYSVCVCLWSESLGEFLVPFLEIGSVAGLYFSFLELHELVSFSDLVPLEMADLSVLVLLESLAGFSDLILRAPADLSHLVQPPLKDPLP